jgi:hypothetical protein
MEAAGMKSVSLFRVILSGLIGLVIAVVFGALVNLILPGTNIAWTLIPICLASIFSGLAGYWVGTKQKKAPRTHNAAVPEK